MDPLSHAITGGLLIGLARRRAGRGAGAAAVLGALAPDLDAVVMPVGWDLYLRVHQIGTHTLAGSVVCALLVATVVRLCTRGSWWPGLLLAAWLGALSHVALDVLSGATVHPWWPLSDQVLRYGLVAMAEPAVVVLLLIAGLVCWRWPARRVNAALTGLALVGVLFVGKAAVREQARRMYEVASVGDAVRASVIEAEWGTVSRWVVLDRTADRVRRWSVDTSRLTVAREIDLPLASSAGVVGVSTQATVVDNLRAAHEFPIVTDMAQVEGVDGRLGTVVRWSDLQYCWAPGAPGAVRAVVGSAVRPVDLPIACGLWFNVIVGGDGRIAGQQVTIGEWTQQR